MKLRRVMLILVFKILASRRRDLRRGDGEIGETGQRRRLIGIRATSGQFYPGDLTESKNLRDLHRKAHVKGLAKSTICQKLIVIM